MNGKIFNESASTERITLLIPTELLIEVDEWRKKQSRIPNLSDALRQLIKTGVRQGKKPS